MTPPVRGPVHVALDHGFKDPGTMRIRDLVEWYKKIVRVFDTLGTATQMEINQINEAWDYCTRVMATAQTVPHTWLMAVTQDLARSELEEEAFRANVEAPVEEEA